MIAEGISETVSEKPRRGRPRSVVREVADGMDRMLGVSGCQRTKVNEAYRLRATGRAFDLTDDEQRILFGSTKAEIWSGKGPGKFPPGWQTAAEEIGRFLVSVGADDDTAADYLRVVVQARRDGIGWRRIRSHFRSLRLGERRGDVRPLLLELARTVDAYRSRFPATPDEIVVAAARRLVVVLSDEPAPETGSPAGNDLAICD
jgi:hypothetical protein